MNNSLKERSVSGQNQGFSFPMNSWSISSLVNAVLEGKHMDKKQSWNKAFYNNRIDIPDKDKNGILLL